MRYEYVVLGTGRQGVALAYDLAKNCEARRVRLIDCDATAARTAVDRLKHLLPDARTSFEPIVCDVTAPGCVDPHLKGVDVVLSAVPYQIGRAHV